jgi:hypothetical protein
LNPNQSFLLTMMMGYDDGGTDGMTNELGLLSSKRSL